jgi:aminopeptidase N
MLYHLYGDAQSLLRRTNFTMGVVSRKYNDPDERFREFGHLIYGKGSWVLHMLRSQLGPELFRQSVKKYLERHQYDTVVTHDLLAAIEEVSGRSYDQFFDQWVHHAHHPELDVNYSWDEKAKLAKVSIKQVQKVSDTVALFHFPLTLRFKSKSGTVNHTVIVREKEEDFYCALAEAPEIVRIDPELTVLARITFRLSNPMLNAQLADKTDMLGRLLAVEQLGQKKDRESVAKLKQVLNGDAFHGVRAKASEMLRTIHTDEALEALLDSTKQSDARVRYQVSSDIAGFYHPTAFDAAKKTLASEKNPAIQAQAIRALGAYAKPEVRETLLKYLNTPSYRERLAQSALGTMRAQDDAGYITPVREMLAKRQAELPTAVLASGLDTLAFLARHEEKKDAVREFLTGHVNSLKDAVQIAAINALGTLDDPKAIVVLEKFTGAATESPERLAAEKAIAALNASRKPGENLRELRNEVMELQKNDRDLRKQLDDLKKKLEAKDAPPTGGKKKK